VPGTPQFLRRSSLYAASLLFAAAAAAQTSYKQESFHENVVFSGLVEPVAVRFLPDGRILVSEKSGLIKVFDSFDDPTAAVVADLRTQVFNHGDRGMLGLTVPPGFDPASPDEWRRYVYVLYSRDALPGGAAPKWGVVGGTSDTCPSPPKGPGAGTDGCVVTGQLSRLLTTEYPWSEQMLLEGWCQQFPSHAPGSLAFGADGKLYVSGGEGASFGSGDWGQFGGTVPIPGQPGTYYTPANPCGDPPSPVGTPLSKPTAEGGALRSQSPRRAPGEPRLLNGAILRVDPVTGEAVPGNPLFSSSDANERRIIGFGLRNPFRFTIKPGTSEVWIGDVGSGVWEEIDRIPDLTSARNFGWPCFEASNAHPQFGGLNICPTLAETTPPFFAYHHNVPLVTGDGCDPGSSSISGMAFYTGGSNYPASYNNALFFADYSRQCMWVMFPGADGNPDPATRAPFAASAQFPVDLQIGPDGNLYYVDIAGGRIIRVEYGPSAVATGSPLFGLTPLTVDFSSAGSAPAQTGDTITYAWDLDGDGQFDDSTLTNPSRTYTNPGTYNVRLKVTDDHNVFNVSDVLKVTAGNEPPTATINSPNATFTWRPDQSINFTGGASDPQDGNLPESALSWTVLIHHCPAGCHTHPYQSFEGVDHGTVDAPDHEYPAFLELRLTATDSGGLENTVSVQLQPKTVNLTFQSVPSGLELSVGTFTGTTPFTRQVIQDSNLGIEAPSQGLNVFTSWSDGDVHADAHPNNHAHPNKHSHADQHPHAHPHGQQHAHPELHADDHLHAVGHLHAVVDAHTEQHPHADADPNSDAHPDGHANGDADADPIGDADSDAHANGDADADPIGDADADSDAHADSRSQHAADGLSDLAGGRLALHVAGLDRPGRVRVRFGRHDQPRRFL